MKLHVIASGSAGNCYTLEHAGQFLVLDIGVNTREIMAAVDYLPSAIAGALVTHEHKDHSKCINSLMNRGVDVYATSGTGSVLECRYERRFHAMEYMETYSIGAFTVKAFPAIHDAVEPANFLVLAGGLKIAYLTDTAYPGGSLPGLSYLIAECNYVPEGITAEGLSLPEGVRRRIVDTHMNLDTLRKYVEKMDRTNLQGIMLAHVSANHGDRDAEAAAIKEAAGGLPVITAYPGTTVEIGGATWQQI